MASSHFIVEAIAASGEQGGAEPKRISLQVEVEGSAPIKSRTELIRAARAIAAEEIQRVAGTSELTEFTATEAREFEKKGERLASRDWPGTYVWRVEAKPQE